MLFDAIFNNISIYFVAVNFTGGGNQSTQRKPSTWHKSLSNFIIIFNYVIGYHPGQLVWLVVFNASFNNISARLRRSVLLAEETEAP